jgi:hypothetical protein
MFGSALYVKAPSVVPFFFPNFLVIFYEFVQVQYKNKYKQVKKHWNGFSKKFHNIKISGSKVYYIKCIQYSFKHIRVG